MLFATRSFLADVIKPHAHGLSVALVQHVKADTAEYVQALREVGVDIPFVISIPYSEEAEAARKIEALGVKVLRPSLEQITGTTIRTVRESLSSDKKLLVQEVGGYLAEWATTLNIVAAGVHGIVEETKSGLWRYEAVRDQLTVPVRQVADTELKRIESHFVGEAVCESVGFHLRRHNESLRYVRMGIIGYGDIGAGVVEALLRRRIVPNVYDIDQIKMCSALTSGCRPVALERLLSESDVVIGATGRDVLASANFKLTYIPPYLASASSRDIEFPVERLATALEAEVVKDETDTKFIGHGNEHILLNNGYPINFSTQSLPPYISDLLFTLLSAAIAEIAFGQPRQGLQRLHKNFEESAADHWFRFNPQTRGLVRDKAPHGR